MDEPRTHFQLSFTSRQALLLFVGLLLALGAAYTFGVLTGLAGRDREPAPGETQASAAVTPEPTSVPPTAVPATPGPELQFPRPVRGVPAPSSAGSRGSGSVTRLAEPPAGAAGAAGAAAAPTSAAPVPTPSPGLQLFEDEGGRVPTHPAATAHRPTARPTPRAAVRTPVPAASAASAFWVQALSATSEKEARTLRDRLVSHGFSSAVVPGPGAGGGRVYRVRVGPFASREEADRAAAKLKTREKLRPWVVPPGK